MIQPLRQPDAPWKERFRAPVVAGSQIAALAPTRGRICSNRSGIYQQYAWDVPTGGLRPLTDRPDGVLATLLSADGSWLHYLDDARGNEIGHYVRVPFEGGPSRDLTPDLPPYSSLELALSRSSSTGRTLPISGS